MARISPYLRFSGNCREAMEFYKKCLGAEIQIMTVGESPGANQMPPKMKSLVMHSMIEKDSLIVMASDFMEQEKVIKGNTVSLSITGGSKEEIGKYFSNLSEGGKITHPFTHEFFGWYGDLTDKFGIDWMFQADNPK